MRSELVVLTLAAFAWKQASCSVVQINETTFASLPPLYALDVWAQCRRPGDVYCIVDAELLAEQPSAVLQLLQEYSKQTLKHYNRTLVHRGVCVSHCGPRNETGGPWHAAAQQCISQSVARYGLQAKVLSVEWCVVAETAPAASGSARALAVLCCVLVALACAATGLHVLADRCAKFEGNKYLLAFSLKQNWAILTYDRSKPRTDDRMKDVACMEGVRFIGMQCVIFSHVLFICIYSYIDNPQFVEKMYDQFGWQAVFNSPLWLQAFFSLSGFLTAYPILLGSETSPFTFVKFLSSVVNRWIRMTPLAVFALWFTIAWFPLLGSGPQWSWLVTRESQDCSERWWYHMLYMHNHLPLGKLCMGHTWYLAADMQLHILGTLVLLVLVRYRRATIPVLCALVAASSVAAGLVVYWNQLTPIITAQSPEALRTMFLGSRVMSLLYLPSWMNIAGYVGGVSTAFILYHNHVNGLKLNQNRGNVSPLPAELDERSWLRAGSVSTAFILYPHHVNGLKLNQNRWFSLLFHLSLTLGGCVVLTGAVFLQDSAPPAAAAAVYSALDRTLVAVFFNIFMLGCVSGCKSAFRDLLCWRGFHALGRLSYCAYLVHFIVLRLTLAGNTQLGHPTLFSLVALLVTASTLTYAVSIPLCLLVELPPIQLWKALTEKTSSPPAPSPSPPAAKIFDLVAHVRRRNDV